MKSNQAFTLIELLVVVLIIGILAAVAVPQYQKAVMRSRFIQIKTLAESIKKAQEVYYLANGEYATDFNELSIEMPAGKLDTSVVSKYVYDWGHCSLSDQLQIACTHSQTNMEYQVRYDYATESAGARICIALGTDQNSIQNQICKNETNRQTPIAGDGYFIWVYR